MAMLNQPSYVVEGAPTIGTGVHDALDCDGEGWQTMLTEHIDSSVSSCAVLPRITSSPTHSSILNEREEKANGTKRIDNNRKSSEDNVREHACSGQFNIGGHSRKTWSREACVAKSNILASSVNQRL